MTESITQANPAQEHAHATRASARNRNGVLLVGGLLVLACGGQMADGDDGLIQASGGANTSSSWGQGGSAPTSSSTSSGSSIFTSYGATGSGPSTYAQGGASFTYASTGWALGGSTYGSTWMSGGSTYGSTSWVSGGSTYGSTSWVSGGSTYGSTSWVSGGSTWTSGGYSGAVNCEFADCAPIDPNCKSVEFPPASCCPQCSCGPCGTLSCAAGYHLELLSGYCCPSCVKDVSSACDSGRQQYATYRELLLSTYGNFSCKSASDCGIIYEKNRCAMGCGVAVSKIMESTIVTSIEKIADSLCGSCSYPPSPPCMVGQATCANGYCSMTIPLL